MWNDKNNYKFMGIKSLNKIFYNEKLDKPMVVCLGFFDCLHQGHLQLIAKAQMIASIKNSCVGVFTFDNNPFNILQKDSFQLLTF